MVESRGKVSDKSGNFEMDISGNLLLCIVYMAEGLGSEQLLRC